MLSVAVFIYIYIFFFFFFIDRAGVSGLSRRDEKSDGEIDNRRKREEVGGGGGYEGEKARLQGNI